MSTCKCGCGALTPLARKTNKRRGHVQGHPLLFINGHNFRSQCPEYIEVSGPLDTPCKIWQRSKNKDGYGQLWHEGRCQGAHVVYWSRVHGPLPEGKELHHRCETRPCVEEAHLLLTTHRENVMLGKVAKVSDEEIEVIRSLKGVVAPKELARRYGVTPNCIYDILTGRTRKSGSRG